MSWLKKLYVLFVKGYTFYKEHQKEIDAAIKAGGDALDKILKK